MGTQTSLEAIWRKPVTEAFVVVLIVALAAWPRLVAIDRLPPGLYRDEAFNGLDALQVLDGERPLFFEANNGREPLFIYLLACSVRVWGRSPGALRLVSALTGIVAVLAIYGLGRACFGRAMATCAALQASGC
jgi:4-amino-4-deoxy-L-arabinose transferase-like glycosyltransferase